MMDWVNLLVGQRTGSKPPAWKGWQRHKRLHPSHTPLAKPNFSTAWAMYSEQVGWNRQAEGNQGDTQRL